MLVIVDLPEHSPVQEEIVYGLPDKLLVFVVAQVRGRSSVAKNFLITESFSSRISAFEDRRISTSSSGSGEEDLEDEGDNETGSGAEGVFLSMGDIQDSANSDIGGTESKREGGEFIEMKNLALVSIQSSSSSGSSGSGSSC